MKKVIFSSGLLLLLLIPAVSASAPITGNFNKCTGLASCTYTLSSSAGTTNGWTYGAMRGYIGTSPLYFSGGNVYFKLPGEAAYTYGGGKYSGQAIIAGTSKTQGTLYHVTGTFSGVDVNTGTVVTGSTDGIVGAIAHSSGRGGIGYTYSLVSGSITFTQTTVRGTSTSVGCTPSPVYAGHSTTCTVTVTDQGAGSSSTPTGTVTFSQSGYSAFGSFSPSASCTLASGTCSVTYTLADDAYGSAIITASYSGDAAHISSTATVNIPITGDD